MIIAAPLLLLVAGCGLSNSANPAATGGTAAFAGLSGHVMGGQQPVSSASVKLWAVNVDGSGAGSLLTTARTSDAGGGFNISLDYTCPTATPANPAPQVYITATGGNAGSGTNGSLALMAALGPCSALNSSTNIVINEVTTVAAVWALQNFMGVTYGTAFADNIGVNGSLPQSTVGMRNAFATAANLVNTSTGIASPATAGAVIESAKINTIANILASCVNSDGTTPCQTLFADVTPNGFAPAADTIQAALYMATNPTANQIPLFQLQGTQPPFQPNLSAAPFDWTLGVVYTGSGLNQPTQLGVDASGNIWIDNAPGSPNNGLVELGPTGVAANGSPFITGSTLSGPQSVVIDTVGKVWVANHGSGLNNIVAYTPSSNTAASYSAVSGCLPGALAIDGNNNAFYPCGGLTNFYELVNTGSASMPAYGSSATGEGTIGTTAEGIAIDASKNIWVANNGSATVTEFLSGNYGTAANNFAVGTGPYGVAADNGGNIWVASSSTASLTELANGGSNSYTTNTFTGGGLNSPRYVAIDGGGNIWVANSGSTTIGTATYVSASEFSNAGVALSEASETQNPGGFAHAVTIASPVPRGIAVDPSGNVWMAGCGLSTSCTNGAFVLEIVGAAVPVVTPLASAIAASQLGCCSFTPPTLGGTSSAATAGYLSLQANNYNPVQNTGSFSFLVTRGGGSTGAISVNYSTSNGTGIAGTDYTATSGTFTWATGDTSVRTITVPFLHNSNYSGTKSFTLTLSGATGGAVIYPIASTLVTVADNLTPPATSSNFVFSTSKYNWKLSLPVDIYGGTGGKSGSQFADQEIPNSQILLGFSDPYFYLNSSNQIVFTAPSNGATTSPGVGTNDTRSELRELYTGTGADSNNDWTSSIGGTLTASCYVQSVSVDTDEATIGQIHAQSLPFVLLVYLPATQQVALQMTNTNSSSSSSTRTVIASNITLGQTINYVLSYSGSTINITVNGNTQSLPVDSSWATAPQYFKVGAYSGAGNTGNPAGDQTQVVFSSFSVTHP